MVRGSRALAVWAGVALAGAIALLPAGLASQLGYDFSVAVALFLGLAVPHLAALRVADVRSRAPSRRRPAMDDVVAIVLQVVLAGLLLAAVPFFVALVRGIWSPPCGLGMGVVWYLLIPCISVVYLAAVGVCFALATPSVAAGLAASYGFLLLTWVVALLHVAVDPPTFFFHGTIGVLPGPIYDEEVSVTPALLWARAGTLAWALFLVTLAASACDPRRLRLDVRRVLHIDRSFEALLPRMGCMLALIALTVLWTQRAALGTWPTARSIQRDLGGRAESDHFVIHFDDGSTSDAAVELMVEDHEFRLFQLLRFLGWTSVPGNARISSYVYPTPEVKKRLIGAEHTSFADPYDRALHLNAEPFPHPVLKHELAHVLSSYFAGPLRFNLHIGLHEGFAVAADWEDERMTPDEWAATMKGLGLLPGVERATSLAFWTLPSSRAYLAMGSFVRYLIAQHGIAAFEEFFRTNDYAKSFHASRDSLGAAWIAGLDTVRVSGADSAAGKTRLERGAIFERRCPREEARTEREAWTRLDEGRAEIALRAFERAASWAPEDPDVQLGRMRALLALGRTDEAERLGATLLARPDVAVRLAESVHDLLGNLAWRRGALDEAREHYGAILRSRATESLVRGAFVKTATLGSEGFRRVLAEEAPPVEVGMRLADLVGSGTSPALAHYLLGRRLGEAAQWPDAANELRAAAGDSALRASPELRAECLRLLGVAAYRAGRFDDAEGAFGEALAVSRSRAEAIRFASWIERCRWRRDTYHPHTRIDRERRR